MVAESEESIEIEEAVDMRVAIVIRRGSLMMPDGTGNGVREGRKEVGVDAVRTRGEIQWAKIGERPEEVGVGRMLVGAGEREEARRVGCRIPEAMKRGPELGDESRERFCI